MVREDLNRKRETTLSKTEIGAEGTALSNAGGNKMARIDTTKIEGYGDMTPEQKVAALEAVEYTDNASEVERLKNAVSKANSEAADWKKKHNALLSEEEQKKQAENEELTTLRKRVEEMEREKVVSGNKAQLVALGYDDALATATATAMAEGDTATVFANQKKFLESHDKAFKAQLMGATSTPPAGSSSSGGTADYSKLIADAQLVGHTVGFKGIFQQIRPGNIREQPGIFHRAHYEGDRFAVQGDADFSKGRVQHVVTVHFIPCRKCDRCNSSGHRSGGRCRPYPPRSCRCRHTDR